MDNKRFTHRNIKACIICREQRTCPQGLCWIEILYDRLRELENKIEDKSVLEVPCPIDSKVYYIVTTFRKNGDLSTKYYHIIQGKATWANMPRIIREWGKTCFGDLETAQKVKILLKNT